MSNHKKKNAFFTTAYFPPVQYISKFVLYDEIYIERFENYQSQSYRNRTEIMGANGLLNLTVPIAKVSNKKNPISEAEIDYTTAWQKEHFRSLENSYKSSPFYEYYIDAFREFFEKQFQYLFDFNLAILHRLLDEIEISLKPKLSTAFSKEVDGHDYRFSIHPKVSQQKPDAYFAAKPYTQVFFNRFDFVSNLSILDLLFNQGPNTENFLRQSVLRTMNFTS